MRIRSVALALLACAAACSTFGDESDDDPPPSPPGPDAAGVDGEAGPPVDGGTATDASSPDAKASFCSAYDASAFLFCRDFDDDLPAMYGFGGKGGTPILDVTTSTSAPSAMWAQTGGTYVRYDTVAASLTKQHAHASMYLGNFGAPVGDPRDVIVMRILQAPGPASCVHELSAKVDGASLDVRSPLDGGGSVNTTHPFGKFIVTRRWTSVDIVLVQDVGGVDVTVALDGEGVLVSRRTTCPSLSASVQVFLGLVTSSTGEARFDDFVFGSY